jgi:hypothetical protein
MQAPAPAAIVLGGLLGAFAVAVRIRWVGVA